MKTRGSHQTNHYDPSASYSDFTSTEPLWTVEDVSNFLRLKPETVRLMARQSKIPSIKVGRVWRFRSLEIKSWLQLQRGQNEPTSVSV
jgi:excisionase family DNA binding protein